MINTCRTSHRFALWIALLAFPLASGCVLAGSPPPAPELPPCVADSLRQGDVPVDVRALRGEVLLIDFWASWCAPCAQSFAYLNALHKEFGERGLTIVGISVDERADDARRFLARYPAAFRTVIDPRGDCPRAFDVKAMPSSYLVSREGRIIEVHRGFRSSDLAARRQAIERALAGPPQ